eukprot:m.91754 g.91754  ORF g.91754 m.91754 type:complete len:97 (-) comp14642_c1_seq2:212-502(-)
MYVIGKPRGSSNNALVMPTVNRIENRVPSVTELTQLTDDLDVQEGHLIVSCTEDMDSMQEIQNILDNNIAVYTTEIILSGALHQRLLLDQWRMYQT